ncbi:evolutionarily conserved signaling intermediate in Toll pathway, mitochondrial-like isoform X2 [Liolophura sinensis]|uniref:evolutionarily conserved signaling intermediate in Toll pathway, mitochondrial-like isoform X2 n=1 Tax=Liolophura sinensis TaxID=3198878 RepID=UPI003158BC9F
MAMLASRGCVVLLKTLCGHCQKSFGSAGRVQVCRRISTSRPCYRVRDKDEMHKKTKKELVVRSEAVFDEAARKAKNKITFRKAVGTYLQREGAYRRGHIEFIYAALKRMKEFGVEKDLDVYKQILDILPPFVTVPKSMWQVEFQHFPKQQQCAIDIMQQMEDNGVIPDNAFGDMILCRFGKDGHASRKYRRIMYWLPKFKNLNPYPIPSSLPDDDPVQMAVIALKRMAVDWENKITVHKTAEDEEMPLEDTFIAYAQSPKQQELLASHPVDKPVYVEGGNPVWVKSYLQTYFVLISDPDPNRFVDKEEDEGSEHLNLDFSYQREQRMRS